MAMPPAQRPPPVKLLRQCKVSKRRQKSTRRSARSLSASPSKALCLARRFGGDRGCIWSNRGCRSDRRFLQASGGRCRKRREPGDTAIRRASCRGNHEPQGEPRGCQQIANGQIARISERLARESADVTGGLAPPQSIAATSQASAPLPPARRDAQPARPSILAGWSIRETRDGYVYVQGHGDVYQVVPGAPLPGLGRVEQIKRQNGHWMVVTPKGIIVSMRDRRYFE